jgi:hypothetical protein
MFYVKIKKSYQTRSFLNWLQKYNAQGDFNSPCALFLKMRFFISNLRTIN